MHTANSEGKKQGSVTRGLRSSRSSKRAGELRWEGEQALIAEGAGECTRQREQLGKWRAVVWAGPGDGQQSSHSEKKGRNGKQR